MNDERVRGIQSLLQEWEKQYAEATKTVRQSEEVITYLRKALKALEFGSASALHSHEASPIIPSPTPAAVSSPKGTTGPLLEILQGNPLVTVKGAVKLLKDRYSQEVSRQSMDQTLKRLAKQGLIKKVPVSNKDIPGDGSKFGYRLLESLPPSGKA